VPFRKRVPERTFHSGTAIAIVSCRVTTTRRSPGDETMARSGWPLWLLGAALTTACAALLVLHRARWESRAAFDPYARSWRRERARTNGEHNSHLFI